MYAVLGELSRGYQLIQQKVQKVERRPCRTIMHLFSERAPVLYWLTCAQGEIRCDQGKKHLFILSMKCFSVVVQLLFCTWADLGSNPDLMFTLPNEPFQHFFHNVFKSLYLIHCSWKKSLLLTKAAKTWYKKVKHFKYMLIWFFRNIS